MYPYNENELCKTRAALPRSRRGAPVRRRRLGALAVLLNSFARASVGSVGDSAALQRERGRGPAVPLLSSAAARSPLVGLLVVLSSLHDSGTATWGHF